MNQQVIILSDFLEEKASSEAECFPVDRYFLEPYLQDIFALDRNEFLLCNFERASNTYSVQLMLCLPELWNNITFEDILKLLKGFTNIFSYYALIEFTYKYLEINLIDLILKSNLISLESKKIILDYLKSSFYPNLIKTDGDYLFFKEDLYGIKLEDLKYIKQKLLLDNRIEPALTSANDVMIYVRSLKL